MGSIQYGMAVCRGFVLRSKRVTDAIAMCRRGVERIPSVRFIFVMRRT